MNFRPKPLAACLVLLSAALFSVAPPLHAQTPADKAAAQALVDKTEKLIRLMKGDNFNYVATSSPTVFVIHFTGDHLKDIKVILAIGAMRTAIWSSLSR